MYVQYSAAFIVFITQNSITRPRSPPSRARAKFRDSNNARLLEESHSGRLKSRRIRSSKLDILSVFGGGWLRTTAAFPRALQSFTATTSLQSSISSSTIQCDAECLSYEYDVGESFSSRLNFILGLFTLTDPCSNRFLRIFPQTS